MLQLFAFPLNNRALLKFLAFKYFLGIFQPRHLPMLKIGKNLVAVQPGVDSMRCCDLDSSFLKFFRIKLIELDDETFLLFLVIPWHAGPYHVA